ncbi:MAG: L-threonylcarbamoyladenylate synthase [Armatimonadota bacterium]|nr:L-threonylcarbamoyladenylate synthase [Armatimonadota bacterium]
MLTQRLILTGDEAHDLPLIEQAAAVIRAGGLVAFPTETVYGLGADALNPEAVRRIFLAKGRPAWDPLIVHVDSPEAIFAYTQDHSELVEKLIQAFMPGPLTLVLPKREMISDIVTAGRNTVAIRIPQHPVARTLIQRSQRPIAAPSANKFGRPSPTTADHVLRDLNGEIEAVLDAGPTPLGVESTVLDLTTSPPTLLRPGGVSKEAIEAVVGPVRLLRTSVKEGEPLPSPGLTGRHYAPTARVLLCDPTPEAFYEMLEEALGRYTVVGAMRPAEWRVPDSPRLRVFEWGAWGDWQTLAQRLFAGLRALDDVPTHAIVCPVPPAEGLARAIRDRLLRAAALPETPSREDN